jgi:hypothetical protein
VVADSASFFNDTKLNISLIFGCLLRLNVLLAPFLEPFLATMDRKQVAIQTKVVCFNALAAWGDILDDDRTNRVAPASLA